MTAGETAGAVDEPRQHHTDSAGHGTMSRGVARAAVVIMLGNVFSRLLGFARDAVTGYLFGTGAPVTGYFTALRIQTSIYDLLVSGVISAAFIPVFSAIRDDEPQFRRVSGTILSLTLIVMALAFGALELFTRDVVMLLDPNRNGEIVTTGTVALRLLGPAVIFLGTSGVLTALLYAKQRFIFPAFSPAIFNLSIVLSALALHRFMGINALVVGVVGGALAQVLLQAYGLRKARLRLSLALRDPRVRQIGRLYLPVLLGLVITQAQVLIDLGLANSTGTHSLSYLTFATRIYQLPLGVVATAMSLASLPTLSTLDGAAYRATLARGLTITLLLIVPPVVMCGVLAYPIIALTLHHGNFNAADARQTADALRFYTPGLGFAALDQLLIFAFYAKHDTKTPVAVGVVSIGFYLVVALATLHPLSFRGLALADSAKQISHAVMLYILLRRWQGRIEGFHLRGALGKIIVSGLAMALLCGAALQLAGSTWMSGTLHLAAFLAVTGSAGVALYLLLLYWWRVPELTGMLSALRSRLARA